jgi:hypothetical protein
VPPTDRLVCRFAAEPPQEGIPYGRWADRLREEFLAACLSIDVEEGDELGEPGRHRLAPRPHVGRAHLRPGDRAHVDRRRALRLRVVRAGGDDAEPEHFAASADYTPELAENHPEWRLDLCDEVLGGWRGEQGNVAAMTLVWGRPLVDGGAVVTAELAGLVVDQCTLVENRFTMLAPDDYRGDTLDVKLWDARGDKIAGESLYDDE